jgi:CubicO group peptidase (beta-lactamase class C family)
MPKLGRIVLALAVAISGCDRFDSTATSSSNEPDVFAEFSSRGATLAQLYIWHHARARMATLETGSITIGRRDLTWPLASLTKAITARVALDALSRAGYGRHVRVSTLLRHVPEGMRLDVNSLLTLTDDLPDYRSFIRDGRGPQDAAFMAARYTSRAIGAWAYGNTGYVLLGAIAENIRASNFDTLARTEYGIIVGTPPRHLSLFGRPSAMGLVFTDEKPSMKDLRIASTAGGEVGTLSEIADWDRALTESSYAGEILRNAVQTDDLGVDYADGYYVSRESGRPIFFHDGYISGVSLESLSDPLRDTGFVIAVDCRDFDFSDIRKSVLAIASSS